MQALFFIGNFYLISVFPHAHDVHAHYDDELSDVLHDDVDAHHGVVACNDVADRVHVYHFHILRYLLVQYHVARSFLHEIFVHSRSPHP
jgi:hypothetical protein